MLVSPLSRNVTPNQVAMFVAAAEAKSFSAAAKALGISQPTLSRSIGDMEYALGCALFERNSRGVTLSTRGESFLEKGRDLLSAHVDAQTALARWRAAQRGKLRVLGSSVLMPLVLPMLMRNLQREYDCVSMAVDHGTPGAVRRGVLEGKAMLGVLAESATHDDLDCSLAIEAQLGILASPDTALPDRIDSLADLAALPILRFGTHSPINRLLDTHGIRFESYHSSPLQVSCILSALELVHQGTAIAVCSGIGASHARAAGLTFIPLPKLLPASHIYVAARKDALTDPAQQRLRDILLDSIHQAHWHPSVRIEGGARVEAALSCRRVTSRRPHKLYAVKQ
jgi:DNA-binding transcriptional LysR family regulator